MTEGSAQLTQTQMLDKINSLEKLVKDTEKPVIYARERKLTQFDPKSDVTDWVETAKICISARFKDDKDKSAFLLEHLDSKIRTEVKFSCGFLPPPGEILDYLISSFGIKDTSNELQKQFYVRNQHSAESLEDYMQALMEILNQIVEKTKSIGNKEELLKFKFADGVADTALRRELKRLNEERPTLTVFELRHHAKTFMSSPTSSHGPAAAAASVSEQEASVFSESISGDSVHTKLHKQQKQLDELTELLRSLATDKKTQPTTDTPSLFCNYCKKSGHDKSKCFKLQRKQQREDKSGKSSKN